MAGPGKTDRTVAVTLGVGSATYQKALPEALLTRGMLRRLLHFGPDLQIEEADELGKLRTVRRFPSYHLAFRFAWGIWTRLPGTGHSKLPVVLTTSLADHFVSKCIPPSDVFHTWTSMCLKSLHVAKSQGAVTLVENASMHPRHWQHEVLTECESFGIKKSDCDVVLPEPSIRRREREYAACDRIVVPSKVAWQSFEKFGHGAKTDVVPLGVDHTFFTPGNRGGGQSVFRVCFVGRVELAKGIAYLLKAWKRLSLPNAQLTLIGFIRPETKALLTECDTGNIRTLGWLSAAEVAHEYKQSDLFVMPSVNEGLAMVLLEAMACGLPVIATDRTGAEDVITNGKDGFVVPSRSVDALADTILWCYQHRQEAIEIGTAARETIEAQFTLAHYQERIIALYNSVAGRPEVMRNASLSTV